MSPSSLIIIYVLHRRHQRVFQRSSPSVSLKTPLLFSPFPLTITFVSPLPLSSVFSDLFCVVLAGADVDRHQSFLSTFISPGAKAASRLLSLLSGRALAAIPSPPALFLPPCKAR